MAERGSAPLGMAEHGLALLGMAEHGLALLGMAERGSALLGTASGEGAKLRRTWPRRGANAADVAGRKSSRDSAGRRSLLSARGFEGAAVGHQVGGRGVAKGA